MYSGGEELGAGGFKPDLRNGPFVAECFGLLKHQFHGGGLHVGWIAELLQDAAHDDSDFCSGGFADGPVDAEVPRYWSK